MKELNQKIQAQFNEMCKGKLYRSELSGSQVWSVYLKAFSKEDDPYFRDPASTIHNCNCCHNFIRRYSNIVSIVDNKVITMFDVEIEGEYKNSVTLMSEFLKEAKIKEVFFETFNELNSLPYESVKKTNTIFRLGVASNHKRYTKEEVEKFGVVNDKDIYTFDHFHLDLPKAFVDVSGDSVESIMGRYRDNKNVFQRAMEEISLDTLNLVKDLIIQGSLLDGQTHLYKVENFIPLKKEYDDIPKNQRDNWCWEKSYNLPIAKFKNELIGVLCSELSEGKELNEACKAWNKRVDPANYMKAVAPITKRQIEEAKKFVQENGYEESFDRRFATLDDIKVSEILHSNVGDGKVKAVSIFDNVKSTSTRHKRSEFDGVEEVDIDKFMKDILPNCTSVEAFLSNNQEGNMVSLTTANNKESKPIFKWDNNYSWTFSGNLAGKSMIKEAVKDRGGNVDAPVRISLFFPDTTDDYDLHAKGKYHIYYSNRRSRQLDTGMLDLDAQGCDGHQSPEKRVENITYTDISRMINTKIEVNNYNGRGFKTLFNIEVEINGEITLLKLKATQTGNTISVGELVVSGNKIELKPSNHMEIIDSISNSKEIYGLETNQFHKVNLVCLSPNHWGNNNVGNKHFFFMLQDCKSPTSIRSFHNENLIPQLADHRKVLETLSAQTMIESTPKQLSGLGFNSSVQEEVILRLSGSFKRVVKVRFSGYTEPTKKVTKSKLQTA